MKKFRDYFDRLLCGLPGTAFNFGVSRVTLIRETHAWIIYFLPIGSLKWMELNLSGSTQIGDCSSAM